MACNVLIVWRNNTLLFAALVLARCIHLTLGINPCVNGVKIERNTQYTASAGQSLVLKCPVSSCTKEVSNVTWCKHDGQTCHPMDMDMGVTFEWTERTEHSAVHLLNFASVNGNDSGSYQCVANYEGEDSLGHMVKVIVMANSVTTMVTTNSINSSAATPGDKETVIGNTVIYALSALGAACLLIIIISALVYCVRRRRRAKSRAPLKIEMPFKEILVDEDKESADILLQQDSSKNNISEHTETETATSETPAENIAEPTTPDSVEEQESVVYADLNHNARRTRNTICMDYDDHIEYATVHLKSTSSLDV